MAASTLSLIGCAVGAVLWLAPSANAQDGTRTLGCQNRDWSAGACRDGGTSGGDYGGLNRAIDNFLDAILPGASPADSARTETYNSWANRGGTLEGEGRWQEAEAAYRNVLGMDPVAGLYVHLAYVIYRQGRYDDAAAFYRRAIQAGAASAGTQGLIGVLGARAGESIDQKQWLAAERDLREALDAQSDRLDVKGMLADVLMEQGRYDEAERQYREMLQIDPSSVVAHAELGALYRRRGDDRRAESEYREALRLGPDQQWVRNRLTILLSERGRSQWFKENNLDLAIATYREAMRVDPKAAYLHDKLSQVLIGGERFTDAEAEAREAVRMDPRNEDFAFGLGRALHGQKRIAEAEVEYRRATALAPSDSWAWSALGMALAQQDRPSEAKVAFEEARRLNSANEDATNGLARIENNEHDQNLGPQMRQAVGKLLSDLGSAQGQPDFDHQHAGKAAGAGGELDFMGAGPIGAGQTAGADRQYSTGGGREPNTDAMVVDLRDARTMTVDPRRVKGTADQPAPASRPASGDLRDAVASAGGTEGSPAVETILSDHAKQRIKSIEAEEDRLLKQMWQLRGTGAAAEIHQHIQGLLAEASRLRRQDANSREDAKIKAEMKELLADPKIKAEWADIHTRVRARENIEIQRALDDSEARRQALMERDPHDPATKRDWDALFDSLAKAESSVLRESIGELRAEARHFIERHRPAAADPRRDPTTGLPIDATNEARR